MQEQRYSITARLDFGGNSGGDGKKFRGGHGITFVSEMS
jgi:hypothetical protein